MSIAIALHALAAAVWVGGMFFAYLVLRPAAGALEPALRCTLWRDVLARFFTFVWVCVLVLLATGYWMALSGLGGMGAVGLHVHLMQGLGIAMMLLFAHVWFAPFARLRRAVDAGDWPAAGAQIGRIRKVVAINLVLGLIVVGVGAGGRWV
jgi:uncharacterized membrane protein